MLEQKPVSGSNLFPVPASSEAGFSAPLQSLPAVFFAKCPRMDVVLLSNEFDVSSNSLSSVVYGCIAPDRGYPPPPVPLLSSVPPCTLLNVEFTPQTRCCIEPPPSVAVLNAYLRVHGSTSSLPRKFEVKECTGRTFFNDDIHSGRKMVGIPPSHE